MILFFRSLAFSIVFFCFLYPLLALMGLMLLGPRRVCVMAPYWWSRFFLLCLKIFTGIGYEVRGMKPEYRRAPYIFASKHQSTWETFFFNFLFHDPAYVLKRNLLWVPPFGWFFARLGMIPIDRTDGMKSLKFLVKRSKQVLAQGRPIVIYPEGTRTLPSTPPDYKAGVYMIYKQCGVPVVPVALNSGCLWPRRQFLKRPGTIVVEVLDPIEPGLDRDAFMTRLESAIENSMQGLYQEADPQKN